MILLGNKDKRRKETGSPLERYVKAFTHACEGIVYAVKHEHNMIIIILATIFITVLGFILKFNIMEWLFVITMIGTITSCELLNSAIEAAVDLVTVKDNKLAKIAKDCGAGATLVLCIISVIGFVLIILSRITGGFVWNTIQ